MPGVKIACIFFSSLLLVIGMTVALSVLSLRSLAEPLDSAVPTAVQNPPIATSSSSSTDLVRMTEGRHATTTVWFGGDVMLSREVGWYGARRGFDTSFAGITPYFTSTTDPVYVIVNFEGCLSPSLRFDQRYPLRFVVASSALPALRAAGITHAALANNHALDCGPLGYRYSKDALTDALIQPFGHPNVLSSSSVTYVRAGSSTIALIGIHTLFRTPSDTEIAAVVDSLATSTLYQIAYVHWGDEYTSTASKAQRVFAKKLASLGIDLVIGHHPHVVQDLEFIDQTLVVYSLGNLIFDQYFSPAVEEGLLLKVSFGESVVAELVPVTSQESRTAPVSMGESERTEFLNDLAARSHPDLVTAIQNGSIILSRSLESIVNSR